MWLGQLNEYAGEYQVRIGSLGGKMSFYVEAGRLLFWQPFSLPIELFPKADDRLFQIFHDGSEMAITFARDS
jgi:hypothetical protein